MAKTALVIRATGTQGKAVIKHLAKTGWNVRAFVSDSSAPRAVALKAFGDQVSLHQGTISDTASLKSAIKGCSAVFLTQMPSWTDDSETREASLLLTAAKAAGISHIIISTQLGLSHPNCEQIFSHPIIAPAVTGKIAAEKLVRESGLSWTALRPSWFNTNITDPVCDMMYPGLSSGKLTLSYTPDMVIPTVDPDDIGAMSAHIFNNSEKYKNRVVDLASEELTVAEIIKEIERASGKKLEVHYRTEEENEKEMGNPYVVGQLSLKDLQGMVKMEEIKSHGVPLTSFRKFLENNKESVVPK